MRNPAEYLPEPASGILGKQRTRETRKARTVKEALFLSLKLSVALLALSVVGCSIYLVRSMLLHSPKFDIAIKEINGLRYVPESLVLMRLKAIEEKSRNLLALDLDQLRRSIEILPWVKAVVVRRQLPDKLIIDIKERVPIAFARTQQRTLLVDEEGILLENRPDTDTNFDLPVISGLETGYEREVLERNQKRIALFKSLMQSLDANGARLSRDVSEVYLHDLGNASVILNDDPVLVHLGGSDFQAKFRRYLGMGKELKMKYPRLDAVDLRYQDQVIVKTSQQEVAEEPNQ